MHFLLFIVLMQSQSSARPTVNLMTPHSSTQTVKPSIGKQQQTNIHLAPSSPVYQNRTTPGLGIDSDIRTSLQIEQQLGGQIQAMDEVQAKVSTLEGYREKVDRPDIDGLKESRRKVESAWSIIGTVVATLFATLIFLFGKFYKIVWSDSIIPRLRKALLHQPRSEV